MQIVRSLQYQRKTVKQTTVQYDNIHTINSWFDQSIFQTEYLFLKIIGVIGDPNDWSSDSCSSTVGCARSQHRCDNPTTYRSRTRNQELRPSPVPNILLQYFRKYYQQQLIIDVNFQSGLFIERAKCVLSTHVKLQ